MMLTKIQIKRLAEAMSPFDDKVYFELSNMGDKVMVVEQKTFQVTGILNWDSTLRFWEYTDITEENRLREVFGIGKHDIKLEK